ncbi:MAG: LysM peptidoglycan-binding domain-containing protein, partial [Pseudomonadota bacterium]
MPYVVVSGDTLSQISKRAYGTIAFDVIYDANRSTIGNNPNLILDQVG